LKKAFQYALFLFFLSLLLIIAGCFLNSRFNLGMVFSDILWLTLAFFVTNFISLFIFFFGQKKENRSQAFYSLISKSVKFLIELIIALIWFLIAKKTSISHILLFFVLYLTFTMFSMIVILNKLKNKSL
jgi:hypothetical protein